MVAKRRFQKPLFICENRLKAEKLVIYSTTSVIRDRYIQERHKIKIAY